MKKAVTYRPIELVHDFHFIPCCFPQDTPLPPPKERLDRLKRLGYGGVGICPSYTDYLSKESFEETVSIIRYAKEIGLAVWIYDEKYYPSGSADGTLARSNPNYEAKAIASVIGEPDEQGVIYINSPHGYSSVMYAFACDVDKNGESLFDTLRDVTANKTFGGGILLDCKNNKNTRVYAFFGKAAFEFSATSHVTRGIRRYTDTLMADATKEFLRKTYEGYSDLGDISEYIEAAFTDEPQFPALCRMDYIENYCEFVKSIENNVFVVRDMPDSAVAFTPYMPWTENLPDAFMSMHGYDIAPMLARLFFDESETGKKIRRDFWNTVSNIFATSYNKTYADFCNQKKINYSGHLLHEEDFANHPYMHGDALLQLGQMDIPGCDMLFASKEQILGHAAAVKLASSAAYLYGKNDVMIEASNIIKDVFPITEDAFKFATSLEAALGATRFLSYYTEFSMPEEAVTECCSFTERLLTALSDTSADKIVYVYIPNSDLWEETMPSCSISDKKPISDRVASFKSFLNAAAYQFSTAGIDFCYINDERLKALASSGKFEKSALVIPTCASLPKESSLFKKVIADSTVEEAIDTLISCGYRNILTDDKAEIVTLKKTSNEKEIFLLVNAGEKFAGKVLLNTEKAVDHITIYNPIDDSKKTVDIIDKKVALEIEKHKCIVLIVEA